MNCYYVKDNKAQDYKCTNIALSKETKINKRGFMFAFILIDK